MGKKLTAARASQPVQMSEFVANYDDGLLDVNNAGQSFAPVTSGDVLKIINLPPGVEILNGEIQVEVPYAAPITTSTIEIGTYIGGVFAPTFTAAPVSLMTAVGTKTAFTMVPDVVAFPGLMSSVPNDLYARCIRAGALATAGKFVVRVMWVQRGKATEAVPG